MNKQVAAFLVFVFVLIGLSITFFMPFVELGFFGGALLVPAPVHEFVSRMGLVGLFNVFCPLIVQKILHLPPLPNLEYFVYSFFLSLSLMASAIALCLVGREEGEDKTILPFR